MAVFQKVLAARTFFESSERCRNDVDSSVLEKFGFALQLLFNSAELSNYTAEEIIRYQESMITERDIRNITAEAREEGREEGLRKGTQENKLKVAKAMLKEGFDNETIARLTELPLEIVASLGENDLRNANPYPDKDSITGSPV